VASAFPNGINQDAPGNLLGHVDTVLGFTIPARHARGRVVRLGPVLDAILSNHGYPPAIERLLAEALTLTALLGSTLKDVGGQLTIQAQSQGGVVDLLVCDYKGGEMRGYVRHDPEKLTGMADEPSLADLFGEGYLAITFDQAVTGERYQGIVPLDGASIAQAAESYFSQSEQIPSLVRLAVGGNAREGHVAGGILMQHLPEGEEGRERLHTRLDHPEWEHVRTLGSTLTVDELVDADLPLERVVWRLFNEEAEIRVLPLAPLSRGCRCSLDHIRDVLSRFPAEERLEMAEADGMIRVDCAFCARSFPIAPATLGE
jgi:molecular chaperone Hsp33